MKNRRLPLSLLVAGLGLYALPHSSAAQLLTRATTRQASIDKPVEVRNPKQRSLKKALNDLEKLHSVAFAYEEQLLMGRQTDVIIDESSLEKALQSVLEPQGLRFRKIKDNLYVIQAGPRQAGPRTGQPAQSTESADPTGPAPAPTDVTQVVQRRISGRVTDENNAGLPGVNLIEKGTSNGTTSDADGNFVLNVSDGATTLVISSVGYVTQEIAIGNRTTINLQLSPDNRTLDEVVVVSYGTVKKSNLTEAVSIINTAQAKKVQAASVVDQIQGRAAGVTVAAAGGAPGSTASIKIRGSGTFNTRQDPIYVIDGVIIESAGSDFNPADVETLTVLKDAAATALYGSRGMNGAIVITTRRGKTGKALIEYSAYYGVQNITKRLPLASREQYIQTWTTAYQNAKLPVPNFGAGNFNTDWQEELIKPGGITDHNLSVSGGSENGANSSNYLVSAGYFDQDGTIVGPRFRRYSGRVNSGVKRGKLNIGESLYLAYTNNKQVNGQPFDQVVRMPPTIPVYDANNLSGFGFGNANNPTFGTNPIGQQLKDDNIAQSYKILGNLYGDYEILPGLTYRLSLSIDYSTYQNRFFIRPGALSYNSPDVTAGILENRTGRFFNTLVENTLNYSRTIGKHQVSGLLGYTRQRFDRNEIFARTEGIVGEFQQQGAGTLNPQTAGFSEIQGLVSYLARVNYSFNDKYIVQGNIRRDASSNFPRDNQVAYFPSVSASWNINREPFMAGVTAIGDLRVRASYGSVGNQAITPYSLDPTIQPNLNYVLGGGNVIVAGAANRQLQNANLRWESKVTTNVGVDATFFQGRLQATVEYFNSLSKNLLLRVPIPISAGNQGENPFDNLGQIRNRGVELSLTYQNKKNDWNYSINGQLTTIRNKVLQLVPTNDNQPLFGYGQITRSAVGGGIAEFFVLQQNGIFQTQEEITAANTARDKDGKIIPFQPNVTPGDVRYLDTNGRDEDGNLTGTPDGKINNDDRVVIGTPFPKLEYGANIEVSYKNFGLTMFFQGVSGNVLFNRSRNWTDRFDDVQNIRSDVTIWTGPGTSTTTPKPIKNDPTLNPAFNTSRWVESGAYGRIRTIQLTYGVPSAMLSRLKMAKANVYIQAQNLLTITRYSGYNPDVVGDNGNSTFIGRGIDQGNYPVPRIVSLGVQVGF